MIIHVQGFRDQVGRKLRGGSIVDVDGETSSLAQSRSPVDRFFGSMTDLLDILEEEAWSQVEEDLLKELGRVEDVGHWLEAWV